MAKEEARESPLIPLSEAAARLGLDAGTLRSGCERGRVPAVRPNRNWFVKRSWIESVEIAETADQHHMKETMP